MSKQEKLSVARRSFFKKAGLGVGALGAAAAFGSGSQAEAAESEGGSYRETEHVKKYYELLKF